MNNPSSPVCQPISRMYILVVPSISPYSQAKRKATPVSTSPTRPPPTRVLVAAPALGAAVLSAGEVAVVVLVGASVVDVVVLVGASVVDVVVLGAGEDVTVAVLKVVLKVVGRVAVSVTMLIAALALEPLAARTLEADATDAEAAD